MAAKNTGTIKSSVLFFICLSLFLPILSLSHDNPGFAATLDTKATESLLSFEGLELSERLQSDPKQALFALAETKFRQGNWEQAARYAGQLVSMDPGHAGAHGILGSVYAITGNNRLAQKELAVLHKAGTTGFYTNIIEAISIAQAGKFEEAGKKLSFALQQDPNHTVAVYYAGSLNLAQERLNEAETSFKKVLLAEPDFTPALAGLGQVYLRQKKMALAAEYYQKAVTNQPEIMMYRRQLIETYKATGQKDAANREMKAALFYVPGVKQHYLRQGMQLLAAGSYREAIEHMDKAINNYKRIPEAHYIKAAALANLKQTSAAVENIRAFMTQQWAFPLAHHYAGMCYLALGQMDMAEQQFKTVISLNPDMGKSFVPLTVIEQIRGNYDRALDGLKLARTGGEPPELVDYLSAHILLAKGDNSGYQNKIKSAAGLISGLKPTTDFSLPKESKTAQFARDRNLMVIYFLNGWYGKAIELNETLLTLNPKDRFAWYYLALSKMAQNKGQDAIAAFKQLILIEPELMAAYLSLGKLYVWANDLKNAETSLTQAIEIDPKYGPVYLARGDLFMQTKAESDAIADYRKAMEIDPKLPGSYHRMAMLYAGKPGKLDEALKLALKAEQLAPRNPVSLDVLGWVYVQSGDINKGLKKLDAASKQQPNDPLIQYHIGVAHYKNNDLKAAQKALQAALKKSKNFRGAEHAREILQKISK